MVVSRYHRPLFFCPSLVWTESDKVLFADPNLSFVSPCGATILWWRFVQVVCRCAVFEGTLPPSAPPFLQTLRLQMQNIFRTYLKQLDLQTITRCSQY